jgi:hypothetical protein
LDVLIAGPLTRLGWDEAGTLQQVRDFMGLVARVRTLSGRRVAVLIVHHESKGGRVSGAWEGAGDSLLHVQGQGHGRTRLYFQKTRHSSDWHGKALNLTWAVGESFAVEEKQELEDDTLANQIVSFVHEHPGTGWTKVEEATPGVNAERRRGIRDRLLGDGQLVNLVKLEGVETLLDHCEERKTAHLYDAADPVIAHLRPDPDAVQTQSASPSGEGGQLHLRPASALIGTQDVDAADSPAQSEAQT